MQPSILFEDSDFIVLNKPAGWLSVPGREPETTVLTAWLANHLGSTAEPFIVHRLDRYTSGVILFAKNANAHRTGNALFLKREVKKTYHFLAAPPPSRPAVQIKEAIHGKPAQTLFEVIRKGSLAFYGKAMPQTGRFHQIRAHAEAGGFPLLGDPAHKGKTELVIQGKTISIPRVCLHAFSLELPFGKFEAPLPEDFSRTLESVII